MAAMMTVGYTLQPTDVLSARNNYFPVAFF